MRIPKFKRFQVPYSKEYKYDGSSQFIRINLLNFKTQFPLSVYLNQIYSVAFYVDLPL